MAAIACSRKKKLGFCQAEVGGTIGANPAASSKSVEAAGLGQV